MGCKKLVGRGFGAEVLVYTRSSSGRSAQNTGSGGLLGPDFRNSLYYGRASRLGYLTRCPCRQILWSDHLRLLDRLRCQEVCKTWNRLLSERPSELEHRGLSQELCVKFVRTDTMHQHIALQLEQEPPTILVKLGQWPTSTSRECCSACCQWLTLQGHLSKKIQLGSNEWPQSSYLCTEQWQLQMVLGALRIAPQQRVPALEVNLSPGSTSITSSAISQDEKLQAGTYLC